MAYQLTVTCLSKCKGTANSPYYLKDDGQLEGDGVANPIPDEPKA